GGEGAGGGTIIFPVPGGGGSTVEVPVLAPQQLWPTLGSLARGRYSHSATLLAQGQVLVAGGTVAGTTLTNRAELYIPSTQSFVATAGTMVVARSNHVAVRLADGRVLLAGGYVESPLGMLSVLDRAEVFDPVTGTFSEVGRMLRPRVDAAAALLPDGRVLVTGGSNLVGGLLLDHDDAEAFDPVSGSFAPLAARMLHTRATHLLLPLGDGSLLLAGGSDSDARCERFEPGSDAFVPFSPAGTGGPGYNACGATLASGAALVGGGAGSNAVFYAPGDGSALRDTSSPLGKNRVFASASRIRPTVVLVVGGYDFGDGGRLLSGCELLVEDGSTPGAGTYPTTLVFPRGMAAHTATRLGDGRILFVGGIGADVAQTGQASAYLLTP
ncbi:MAG: kelch repeat-containing protein, partial [Planctomycetia bacterium]